MKLTDDEIREAAAQKLIDDRRGSSGTETTPGAITPAILSFASDLGGLPPAYIPVVADSLGRYGWCSDGVRLKVNASGGQYSYGWTIWAWADALLTAEFHCVWRSPSGDLFDITPKPNNEASIVFVEMPTYQANFNFDDRPRNRRRRIYEAADRQMAINSILERHSASQRAYEQKRAIKAGLTLEEWIGQKVPVDPIPAAVDELIEICDQFEAHYDSLGTSGHVAVDRKFVELAKRRFEVQAHCQALLKAHGLL